MNNKDICRAIAERGFNQGDGGVIDEYVAIDGVDHQEPPGTPIVPHMKHVISAMRTAFPDLHFAMREMVAEGDWVGFRLLMTGTHTGSWASLPGPQISPTGRRVEVTHLYLVRIVNGKMVELWHEWNVPRMLQQLGVIPGPQQPRAN